MLTYIHVDGFRSLSNFEMHIKPGLNILIGPNGSGKSNIISFFQFLSRIMTTSLSDAVSLSGGVGSFFQKIGPQTFRNEVKVTLRGQTFTLDRDTFREKVGEPYWAQYQYSFTIQASERFDSIVFFSQTLSLSKIGGQRTRMPDFQAMDDANDWDIVLRSFAEPSETTILKFTPDTIPVWRHRLSDKQQEAKELLEEALQLDEAGLQSTSLVSAAARPIELARIIVEDLRGGETLNINPSKVKEPEDSARAPGIRSDGSGLAATLWHLRNEPQHYSLARFVPLYSQASRRHRARWPEEVHSQVQSLIRLINSQIETVIVDNDRFDNQLKIKIKMRVENKEIDLPFAAMSDGTIKWMSLITAILTSGKVFAIEEPENFLHPLMLIEILKLMRSTTADKFSFVVMTTHSETLLNAASPNEVVVVAMENGVTRGSRPSDPDHLASEIRETGFGLGHYYLVGAINDA